MALKRIVVLNHFAAPLGAPGGTRHVELFGALEGWETRIIAGNRNYLTQRRNSADSTYTTVWTLPYDGNGLARVLNWLSYVFTATAAGLRKPRPDVVFASSPHLLAALAGFVLSRLRRARFVLEIRDLWPQVLADMGVMSERSVIFRSLTAIERFLYRNADAIVCLSKGIRTHLIAEGFESTKIHLVPNGADPANFEPPASRQQLRSRFGVDGFVFAYTGAHGPANGLDLLIDAAAEVRDELPEACFLLVGDGAEKSSLVRRVELERLTNVRFLPAVPKREMPALLGAVDVGVHVLAPVPLFSYGVSPNKLFDYMAAGLPVITNTPGEVAALVHGAGAGLAVGPRDLAAAARTMVKAGRDERRHWGDAGRSFISAHHSTPVLARQLEQVLESVIER